MYVRAYIPHIVSRLNIQSRIRPHVCVLFKNQAYFILGLWWCQRNCKAQKWSFASTFISWRRKRIYIRSAYCMKVQPLLVPMVPSISVYSAFFGALQPKSGCLSEKKVSFFCIFWTKWCKPCQHWDYSTASTSTG